MGVDNEAAGHNQSGPAAPVKALTPAMSSSGSPESSSNLESLHLEGVNLEQIHSAMAVGELIGRALSISAMDSAINESKHHKCDLKYQTPVKVIDYYQSLLTTKAWNRLLLSVPVNWQKLSEQSATTTFEAAFKNAYFCFSHYARASDSVLMRVSNIWAHWAHGAAIVCCPNQELTDRMALIYFSNLGDCVAPHTVSVNLDQDKTSPTVCPNAVPIQSAEELCIFSPDTPKQPYIVALHCYAIKDSDITVGKLQENRQYAGEDKEAPRYVTKLVSIQKAAKKLLRQMLPTISGDADSVKWFKVDGGPGRFVQVGHTPDWSNNSDDFDNSDDMDKSEG